MEFIHDLDPLFFFFESPFYKTYYLTNQNYFDIKDYSKKFELHCKHCKKEKSFVTQALYKVPIFYLRNYATNGYIADQRAFQVALSEGASDALQIKIFLCTHDDSHTMQVAYRVQLVEQGGKSVGYAIDKVGQYPSIADLKSGSLSEYEDSLPPEKFEELKKAILLYSFHMGIAAFVYIRRIFEFLISQAQSQAEQDLKDPNAFKDLKIKDKIKKLGKDYLPEFLVDHKEIYLILSDGVHNLNEDQCLKHFVVLKAAIELILTQKIEREKLNKKTKEISAALSSM